MKGDWEVVWQSPGSLRFTTEVARFSAGTNMPVKKFYRFSVKDGIAGGVAVVRRDGLFALVKQYRPAVDKPLWEFPRGMGEKEDTNLEDTAWREAQEELGVEVNRAHYLGDIFPDSAVLANPLRVVAVAAGDTVNDGDGEVEEIKWVSQSELEEMIRAGEICDGITLAAYSLWKTIEGAAS